MAWEIKVKQSEAVKSFLVTDGSGKCDLEASVAKFRVAALNHLAKTESDTALISQCMTSLFDQYRGANLNLQFVCSHTVQLMGQRVPELKDPQLFSMLTERVEEYLHENTDQPAVAAKGDKPAVAAITGRTYGMRKGAGGGFYRNSDRPVGAPQA